MSDKKKKDSTKYIVDVPNYDKKGNDVTSHHPRGGGRRRKDGTLETSTDNYVPLDEYKDTLREEIKDELRDEIKEEILSEIESTQQYEIDDYEIDDYKIDDYEYDNDTSDTSILGTVNQVLETLNSFAELLANNPEIVEGAVNIGGAVKHGVKDGVGRIKNAIKKKDIKELTKASLPKKVNRRFEEEKDNDKEEYYYHEENSEFSLAEALVSDDYEEIVLTDDEAKVICLRMLSSYISLRQDYETLKKAKMVDAEQLSEMMQKLEGIVNTHPKLLEEGTQKQVKDMIEGLSDETERRKLLQLFRMN
ncbi:hypothetical protein [Butyrivibrio sp. MB2005]|uniref:hypothetical protein n=1 Tax=Butyrivibrio sp. MB2005 TaxID=1280678 RepID=UPI0003FF433D|nr:hypothetical protein [Butyrivibrio sp. MB2005]